MTPAGLSIGLLLATTAIAVAAEGGPIRTGEHPGFSRVVLQVEPSTEWSLDLAPGRATLVFPRRDLDFGTDGVWQRMPRTRVTDITPSRTEAGTAVRVELGCECRVSTTFVDGRYLAVDVHDRDPTDAAAERPQEGTDALAAAERLLLQQLQRAADQGLVELAAPEAAVAPADAPGLPEDAHETAPDAAPEAAPKPRSAAAAPEPQAAGLPADSSSEPPNPESEEARLLAHLGLSREPQVAATTVFDRDDPTRRNAPEPDPACRPDQAFDLVRWSDGRAVPDQIADLRRILVGEFDRPNPAAIGGLARLHIRHGLGTEAAAILASFEAKIADRDLLADLARLVESRPAQGPLARDIACPGRHGLWLALAGRPASFAAAEHFPSLRAAFEELPLDLRAMLGPDLVNRFIEAGRVAEARVLHDVAIRAATAPDAVMQLAAGRLAAAEARLPDAEATFAALVERRGTKATDALFGLVRARLAGGGAVPETWLTDLRAVALEQRGGPREIEARLLAAEALARNGDLRAAFAGLAALASEHGTKRVAAEAIAPRLLAEADPDRSDRAAFAEAVLAHGALVTAAPANDGYRATIAANLLDLGLANAALDMLAPASTRPSENARLLAARAHLALGDGAAAIAQLEDLPGREAAGLRARAEAARGDFTAATAASAEAGAEEAALDYAWAGGDWARAAASPDPRRAAMAGFMRDREAETRAAPPSPLTPEAAFAARPPSPEKPSLAATRMLVESGREVRSFVEGLLARYE